MKSRIRFGSGFRPAFVPLPLALVLPPLLALVLPLLALAPTAHAQNGPLRPHGEGRPRATAPQAAAQSEIFMLEAGLVGGNSLACPGRYVAMNGQVGGPASLYGMVEEYRCIDFAGSALRFGASLRLGPASWLVRPAVRGGVEFDGGDLSPTLGASLTMGRRYGGRVVLHRGQPTDNGTIVLVQLGGYLAF